MSSCSALNHDALPAAGDDPYDDDGVDRSLIRWMLQLTPTQRLEMAQDLVNLVGSVKRGFDPLR